MASLSSNEDEKDFFCCEGVRSPPVLPVRISLPLALAGLTREGCLSLAKGLACSSSVSRDKVCRGRLRRGSVFGRLVGEAERPYTDVLSNKPAALSSSRSTPQVDGRTLTFFMGDSCLMLKSIVEE